MGRVHKWLSQFFAFKGSDKARIGSLRPCAQGNAIMLEQRVHIVVHEATSAGDLNP